MSEVTRILDALQNGEQASEELLPLVYEELRRLAAAKLAREKSGQTLDATALVHDAYLRLVGPINDARWESRSHFFAAAAEAMRRILVDRARRKLTMRHGGAWQRIDLTADPPADDQDAAQTLAIHETLDQLGNQNPRAVEVVKMRVFLQMTFVEIGDILGLSPDTAESDWAFARAWLKREWKRQS